MSTNNVLSPPCSHQFCEAICKAVWHTAKFFKRHGANLFALLFMATSMVLNVVMLTLAHERVPLQTPTLPDIVFDFTPYYFNTFTFSEVFIGAQNICFFLLLIFHPEREIILRRFMFIMGILYFARTITFSCTNLPTPFDPNVCLTKQSSNTTVSAFATTIVTRVLKYALTMGLVSKEKHILCGDYIFSGHTLIILIVYLFINTYFFMNKQRSKTCLVVLENMHFFLASVAVTCVLISRQHYTIDVVFSYYITTRTFWAYHSLCLEKHMFEEIRQQYENDLTLRNPGNLHSSEEASTISGVELLDDLQANEPSLKVRDNPNLISQVWWWPIFIYMEIIKKPPTKDHITSKYQVTQAQFCLLRCWSNSPTVATAFNDAKLKV